ncbi:23463_t:CDS:2 [Cetraspora pellucida]|uniref:23463_t:CDS:1 n=1 Tax=Cetraspora pellucida TaxID=1433469 RepID=A0A9N9EHT5_9GLOM|nr:23463_t:CDS:2 [Cetraspora pellucida]
MSINEKLSFVGDVPPTVACTSDTSTQSRDVAEIDENAPSFQKEQSVSNGFENLQLDLKIWVKYGDSQPTLILFEGEIVDDLKKVVKKKLSPKLDDVTVDDIIVRRHDEEDDLRPGLVVDGSFINDDETPLQVIARTPTTLKRKHEEPGDFEKIVDIAIEKALSRQKPAEMIRVSNLSDTKARDIIDRYELKFFQPFLWSTEISEDHQKSEVVNWFKKALDLPRDFHIKDIHKQSYQRQLQTANAILTGGACISIGPSDTSCIWIETKKNKEKFKRGQAIGELLIMDNEYAPRSLSVLTDCNDNWIIFFFLEVENQEHYLASSTINDRSIALGIIKQFVLDEGKPFLRALGKNITYEVNLPEPLKKRSKFLSSIPEVDDERMADVIDDMTEKELYNMTMRKRLKLAKNIVRIEEQPIIDQLIRQFSDDYENPTS